MSVLDHEHKPEPTPWQLRLAWQIARRLRTCPPSRLLTEVQPAPELIVHTERCPFCTERLRAERLRAGKAPDAIRFAVTEQRQVEPSSTSSHPGEIRALKRELGGWGPGWRYFNPPMVLVVDGLAELEAVRVVQLYDDPTLAGPGDLPVDPEDPSLYAETWNGYAVRQGDLGRCYGEVPAASLEAVRCAIEGASGAGEGIEERSAVAAYMEAFRRLEVEVAAYFAVRVLGEAWL